MVWKPILLPILNVPTNSFVYYPIVVFETRPYVARIISQPRFKNVTLKIVFSLKNLATRLLESPYLLSISMKGFIEVYYPAHLHSYDNISQLTSSNEFYFSIILTPPELAHETLNIFFANDFRNKKRAQCSHEELNKFLTLNWLNAGHPNNFIVNIIYWHLLFKWNNILHTIHSFKFKISHIFKKENAYRDRLIRVIFFILLWHSKRFISYLCFWKILKR